MHSWVTLWKNKNCFFLFIRKVHCSGRKRRIEALGFISFLGRAKMNQTKVVQKAAVPIQNSSSHTQQQMQILYCFSTAPTP